jgi:hypothetical protein
MKHLIISLTNSGLVTIMTSLAMTYKALHTIDPLVWLSNWLISWFIVCNFVYWIAPKIAKRINEST